MELNDKVREMKIEQISVYLNKFFPKEEHSRDDTLNFIVEHFFSQYFRQIVEANKEKK